MNEEKELMSKKRTLTLLEVMIVVTIISILAALAMPAYVKAKKRAVDREAQSQLKIIQLAEKKIKLEEGGYITCASNTLCNLALNLDLPSSTANGGHWDYAVTSVNLAATPPTFTAVAKDAGGVTRWTIDQDDKMAH